MRVYLQNVRLRGAVREMSDKDRSSPTLVENSLKSLLDQPSIFPLIEDVTRTIQTSSTVNA